MPKFKPLPLICFIIPNSKLLLNPTHKPSIVLIEDRTQSIKSDHDWDDDGWPLDGMG